MKKLLLAAMLIIAPIAGASEYNKEFAEKLSAANGSILDKFARSLNKQLAQITPLYVDSITTVESINMISFDRSVIYKVTLEVNPKRLQGRDLNPLKTELMNNQINIGCSTPQTRTFLEGDFSVKYYYYDKASNYLFEYSIDKNHCK